MLQKEVADTLHISVTSYAYYELQIRTPSYQHFIALTSLLDTSCDILLGWNEGSDF